MLLREVRYGIRLDWSEVRISPFGPTSFAWHIGNVNVDYSPRALAFSVPGTGSRTFKVEDVAPSANWTFSLESLGSGSAARGGCASSPPPAPARSTADGRLVFDAPVGVGCTVRAVCS